MEVFVIPIGHARYELYTETPPAMDDSDLPSEGFFGRLRERFSATLRAAEERRLAGKDAAGDPDPTLWGRLQSRTLAWVAERIAEQRLLWNLRGESTASVAHPQDMAFEQVMTLVRRILQRDHDRHRLWLAVDAVLLIASAPIALVPGPNFVAYYFAFRVVGHWLSMRGAARGLRGIAWTGRPLGPLTELRDVSTLEPGVRDARVRDIADRLHLQHLPVFFDRVASGRA